MSTINPPGLPVERGKIHEFADAILDDGPIVNGSSNEALRTIEMVYRIYRADSEWSTRWDLAAP